MDALHVQLGKTTWQKTTGICRILPRRDSDFLRKAVAYMVMIKRADALCIRAWTGSLSEAAGLPDVIMMTDRECLDFLVKVRFGDWASVGCAHCGTVGKHYWRPLEKRWKCMGCGSCFSITSGTVFSHRKKSLREIITSVLMWVNSAGGQPALELKRHMKVSYATAFTMQHRMREAMVRGYNVALLNGDIEVDGEHQCGHRSAEKRGKPQGSRPMDASTPLEKLNETMLTQTGRTTARAKKGGVVNPEFGRTLPEGRRLLFSARQRSGVRGKGASATRVAVGMTESAPVVEATPPHWREVRFGLRSRERLPIG